MKDKKAADSASATNEQAEVLDQTKYTAEELVAAADAAFGVRPEMAYAALKTAKVSKATKDEAAAIIKEFAEKEVK